MRKISVTLMCLASVCHVSMAVAEEPHQLATVVVEGEMETLALTSPDKVEAEAEVWNIPGSVDVVGVGDYENTRAATVKDMLDFVPGVQAQSRTNEESRLSIRGSGLSRNFHMRGLGLYQDGIPLHMSDGSSDFQEMDPLAYDHLTVYKGANAMSLGTATLGGAINFVSPTGYTADRFRAQIDGGSFGTMRGHVATGDVVGNADYFMSFTKQMSDGFREHSRQNNAKLNGNVGLKLSDSLETRMYLTYIDANQELPGAVTKAQMRANPSLALAGNIANNYQRDYDLIRLANKTTWQGDVWRIDGGVFAMQKDLFHPIFQLVDQQNHEYGLFGSAGRALEFFGLNHEVKVGTTIRNGDVDNRRFVNNSGGYGALTAQSKDESEEFTLYAEDSMAIAPSLKLITGGQFMYATRDFHDKFLGNGDQSGEKDYYGFSPRIGMTWDVQPDMQVYGNLSAAYEPPTFSELTQSIPGVVALAPIDAQKSYTLEIGTRGGRNGWQWDVAAYHALLRDELMILDMGGGSFATSNADKTYHQGIEIGMGRDWAENWSSRLAYTWSRFRFDGDSQWGDNDIPGAPEHYLRAEVEYHRNGWYIAPNMEAVLGSYYADMANETKVSPYMIFGLTAGMQVTEQVEWFVDARNLLDKNYAQSVNVTHLATPATALYYPGDGRSFYTGLRLRF